MNKKLILKMATIMFAAVSFSALNNSNVTTYAMEDSKLPSNEDIKNSANKIKNFKETLGIVKEKGNLKVDKIHKDMLKEFEDIKNEYDKIRENKLKQIKKNRQELKNIIELDKQNDKIIDEIAKMDNEKIAELVDKDAYKYEFYQRIKDLKLNIDEIELVLKTAEINIQEVEKMFRDSEISESKASEFKNEKKPNKDSEENKINIDSTEQTDEDENKIDWDFLKEDADIVYFFKKIKETKDDIEKHKNELENLKKANNLTDEQIKEISEKNKKESDPIYYEKVRQETQILNVRKEELKKLFELAKQKIYEMKYEKFIKFDNNTYKLKAQLKELKDKVYEYRESDKEWEYAKKIMKMSDDELSKEQEQKKHKITEEYLRMRDFK